MRIGDASDLPILDESSNGTMVLPAISPGELSILQIEPADSLEAVLAVLAHHGRPVLISLPECSQVFSQTEHFARLRRASTPPIVSFIIPRERMSSVAQFAHEQGFHFTPTLAKAEAVFLQLHYQSGLSSGPLTPMPEADFWQSPNGASAEPRQPSIPLPRSDQMSSLYPQAKTPWPTQYQPNTPLSAPSPPSMKPNLQFQGKGSLLPLMIVVSILLIASAAILPALFAQSGAPLTVPIHQNNGAGTAPTSVGLLAFASSGQLDPNSSTGLNDSITISLHDLVPAASSMSYYAWLLSDKTQDTVLPILLGKLQVIGGKAQLTYQDPNHTDLLVNYSRFLVTEQSGSADSNLPPLDTKTWRYQGGIPDIPTPGDEEGFSLLSHMRHLLAKDPTLTSLGLSGGLDIWLYRNTGKVFEWANAARDDWSGNNTDLLRQQIDQIVEYLDGQVSAWKDLPTNTPWLVDPHAGRPGIIDVAGGPEVPLSYVSHIRLHLAGLDNAPGRTDAQKQLASQIDTALMHIQSLLQSARNDAVQLAQMSNTQLRNQSALTLLNDLQIATSNAYVGIDSASESTPGVVWVHNTLERLTSMNIIQVSPNGP